MQKYGADGGEYMDDWLHFEMDHKERQRLAGMGIPFDKPVEIENLLELSRLVESMTYEYHSSHPLHEDNLMLYMRLLFHKLSENFSTESSFGPHYSQLNRIRSQIYNEPFVTYSVDLLAKEATLSRSSFQHIYRELFQTTVSKDIISARIDYARYLLASTSFSVSQIASMCGYHSDVYFMRQFKATLGVTPSQYRENGRR